MPPLALLAGLLLLGACQRAPEPATDDGAAAVADEEPAVSDPGADDVAGGNITVERPELKGVAVDGTPYDLAEHRGRWVVVNFWATWCKPCLKEMPELSALDAMREHIEVVGLAYEEIEVAEMKAFLEKHPVVYPVVIIDTYDPPADFETPRGLPMTYLIAPDGRVADRFLGPVTAQDIESAIGRIGQAVDAGSGSGGGR
ncbi:TlpA family protein disulfide reductase [Marilutibacter chinensis]|uniref:TlpA family protein disulfide reductase n=1 Tax=Marilutibacter chinensis TaxID=2912247 RepID=A0ABS9HT60_9GAMM|nr:TlpA disulfide reductase family protein [Lysobacter chinensis]MCF7221878.1 TlpA family protein disulfide reductase [Lysobacter chinensis]